MPGGRSQDPPEGLVLSPTLHQYPWQGSLRYITAGVPGVHLGFSRRDRHLVQGNKGAFTASGAGSELGNGGEQVGAPPAAEVPGLMSGGNELFYPQPVAVPGLLPETLRASRFPAFL